MDERTYSEDEVQAVLRRAVEQHSQQTALRREDLFSIAEDMGIPAKTVRSAILDVERDSALTDELAVLQRSRRHSLASSFVTWAVVNGGLLGVCAATQAGFWDVCYWTLGIWGTLLVLKAQRTIFPNPDRDRRRAEKSYSKRIAAEQLDAARHRTVLEREARRLRPRPAGGTSNLMNQLDAIVEQGVTDLVEAAARKMGVSWGTSNSSQTAQTRPERNTGSGSQAKPAAVPPSRSSNDSS